MQIGGLPLYFFLRSGSDKTWYATEMSLNYAVSPVREISIVEHKLGVPSPPRVGHPGVYLGGEAMPSALNNI